MTGFMTTRLKNGLRREKGVSVHIVCNEICMKIHSTRVYQDASMQFM